ncbi:MAG: GspE/PulE family protein [Patescibacteria group bacterium]|nr:GspE/PulE family protein [Patescibacteria group bacterium]
MALSPKQFLAQLVTQKILDQQTADRYEVEILQKNIPVDEYLIQVGIKKDIVLKIKAASLNVSYVDINTAAIDPQALNLVPEALARRYTIIPYQYDAATETLSIATTDPLNFNLVEFLESKTRKRIIFSLAIQEDILKAINNSYSQNLSPEVRAALKEVAPSVKKVENEYKPESNAPIAKIVNTILDFAIKSRASDIHIEPLESKTRVRYRIDGILQEKLTLPRTIHESLISRLKILSDMKIDEHRIPQDGRFNYRSTDEEIDIRASTLPTVHGEKMVMRLLKKSGGIPSLADLGLSPASLKLVEEAISRPNGIVLVTGPTGSGKTTTLYSILNKLNTLSTNIVTLEDPVEYQIPGINQVQVNPQAGLTFAAGLKSFLRQDPNIILVGEIRDKDTTSLAIQAALTGHLVFSTLHTNDSASTIARLIDLGGENFLIASVLDAIIAQRIVRRICESCKTQYEPEPSVIEDIKNVLGDYLPPQYKQGEPIKLWKGAGCEACDNSGYLGRIGIYEVLRISPAINKLIFKNASTDEIFQQSVAEGLITMKQDGYVKALDGRTTIEEILRTTDI